MLHVRLIHATTLHCAIMQHCNSTHGRPGGLSSSTSRAGGRSGGCHVPIHRVYISLSSIRPWLPARVIRPSSYVHCSLPAASFSILYIVPSVGTLAFFVRLLAHICMIGSPCPVPYDPNRWHSKTVLASHGKRLAKLIKCGV
jgi:hypothetical protein